MEVLLGLLALVLAVGVIVMGSMLRKRPVVDPGDARPEQFAVERDEIAAARQRLDEREDRVAGREERLTELATSLQRDRDRLDAERENLAAERGELTSLLTQARNELERLAGLGQAEARAEVIAAAEHQIRAKVAALTREIADEAVENAEVHARRIVADSVERVAVEAASEAVVTSVDLPNEELKGRIIGREGRNIRAFEQTTGVSLLIDDTPGLVLLSCFDPVRREVARQTLAELIADGRIDPARIEEVHQQTAAEVERGCIEAASQAIDELELTGIPSGLLPSIGALKYRTSYGQNVLDHSSECARLAGAMAAELGLDVETCRRAGFLHDLGKAVITRGEGSHAAEGAELARKHGMDDTVVNAIAAHHDEVPAQSAVDVIIRAADAISSARPGARRESAAAYVRRLEKLEEIATRQEGVERAYALQAGREVRVMVVPELVDDAGSRVLARQIAEGVEKEVTHPGKVKVTVIRETRATEVAH